MIDFGFNPVQKPSKARKVKGTQSQKGDISTDADAKLRQRSLGVCELCGKSEAVQRAHLIGRKHINRETTELDLAHVCVPCHKWLDEDPRGIQVRRLLVTIIDALESEGM